MTPHDNDLAIILVRRLIEAGAEIQISLTGYGGWIQQAFLDPKDAPLLLRDKDAFEAKYWGVSIEQFVAWRRSGFEARCGARTLKGRRCRNSLRGMVTPAGFAEYDGGYCFIHG